MLTSLNQKGYSDKRLERALGLPSGVIATWKYGESATQASFILLQMLCVYPWLIEVADASYDEEVAQRCVLQAAQEVK